MLERSGRRLIAIAAVLAAGATIGVLASGQAGVAWPGVLDEHPAIQWATRQPSDRIAKLAQSLGAADRALTRDSQTGYLRSLLKALNLAEDSQLLVFSKTGVQSAYT